MMRSLGYSAAALWLVAALTGLNIMHGGAGISASNVLLPLTGNFLVTANSGTLTFANSQTRIGWDVVKNGSRTNEQAISICNAQVLNQNTTSAALTCVSGSAGTNAYLRKNTLQPSPWPGTACYTDSITAAASLTAPTGSVANHDGTWTWGSPASGGNYPLLLNGTQVGSGSKLILSSDDGIYVYASPGWYVRLSATAIFAAWTTSDPTVPPLAQFRKSSVCPAGL